MAYNARVEKEFRRQGMDRQCAAALAGAASTLSVNQKVKVLVKAGMEPNIATGYVNGTITSAANKTVLYKNLVFMGVKPTNAITIAGLL